MGIGRETVEHFDESEGREIEIDDRNYPELLKRIKKPPKALRLERFDQVFQPRIKELNPED